MDDSLLKPLPYLPGSFNDSELFHQVNTHYYLPFDFDEFFLIYIEFYLKLTEK